MSTEEDSAYEAAKCIDDKYSTLCSTKNRVNSWISVQIPSSPVEYVVLYNRRDDDTLAADLGTVSVYVGSKAGMKHNLCGTIEYDAAREPDPYIIACNGVEHES